MSYCVLDFETTGLSPYNCEVIEVGAVRVKNGELDLNFASLCKPHGYISRRITEITGISERMTMDCPHFDELLPFLIEFIGKDTLVCHNVPFDKGFLDAYCAKAGIDFRPATFCTLQASRRLLRGLPNHKLGTVAAHLGIKNAEAHRALGDAMTTARVLLELLKM
ncbi:hypothetical protein FACS18949_04970 [Clostridia bacterium]|nr:hypothetical protein FACS189425_03850 [Clostridia bacterium]GHV32812.1 hypothetical protein FACS18949_04970 [Clostridia bacterium]